MNLLARIYYIICGTQRIQFVDFFIVKCKLLDHDIIIYIRGKNITLILNNG